MRFRRPYLLLLIVIATQLHAQDEPPELIATLKIGDPAPPLRLREWLKGQPFQQFEKGQVYVVEFWATWCGPCRTAIPHLSSLAQKYKGKATILGVDLFSEELISLQKVKTFVDSMGNRMNYHVAAEDSNYMSTGWVDATGQKGIPRSFVVDREGRIAWVGHPMYLGKVLHQIVNNKWSIEKALVKSNFDKYLDSLDREAYFRLIPYRNQPEMTLFAINSMVVSEPGLKYAPHVAYQTFVALLKTDTKKALEYGRAAIVTSTYEHPAFVTIINVITTRADSLNLPAEIYQLGAEACEAMIDWIPYTEYPGMEKGYSKMAAWYFRANKRSKAIKAQEKAIEILKSKKDVSANDLEDAESKLEQYKTR